MLSVPASRPAGSSGRVHFVGIGGVGMAGLARHLAARGWRVSGSDRAAGRITDWLSAHGIDVSVGHGAELDRDVSWVIRTPAVRDDNPELVAARVRGVPVHTRGAVLPALMAEHRSVAVCGTHGKTTSSSMIATILHTAGWDPSYCIGGELDSLQGVAGVGDGDWFVAEADESDGTLRLYHPDLTLVTNVEHDHMEHFPDEAGFLACFEAVVAQTRNTVICCAEDPAAVAICSGAASCVTYGFDCGADVAGGNLHLESDGSRFDVESPRFPTPGRIRLPVAGRHNALNALGAAATALAAGVPMPDVVRGLALFAPARRRFERIRTQSGVIVFSDYAHHPTELRAVIDTARGLGGSRLRAVFQPHRYTRTRALLEQFPPALEGLDELILTPVYAASEAPHQGADARELLAAVQQHGSPPVRLAEDLEQAWSWLRDDRADQDVLLILGAGDVEQLAQWARRDLG